MDKRSYGNLGDEEKGLQSLANKKAQEKKALEELAATGPVAVPPPEAEKSDFEERVKRYLRD